MTRRKHQQPKVHATGKRERLWTCEYREYFIGPDGKEHSRHKSKSWSRDGRTKHEAQMLCNAFMLALSGEPPKPDGSMTLAQFWDTIYLPIRRRKWTGGTETCVLSVYRKHILPKFGAVPLMDITKAAIQIHLGTLADAGLGESIVEQVRVRLHSILDEATDNDFIPKNPCRKIETPACTPPVETRSLTEDEIQKLWDGTTGQDYLWWRILILTGARIGELLTLERADIRPDGLMIDEAMVRGTVKLPKRNKKRLAALTDSLRAELEEWLTSHDSRLIFPTPRNLNPRRDSPMTLDILKRGKALVAGLTFRQCRTTFASMFEGDEADRTSIMGHTSPAFTLTRYRKPIQERRQKSVEELDARLRKVVEIKRAG